MKTKALLTFIFGIPGFLFAADNSVSSLQVYPKNLARHHIGSNLFLFDAKQQTFLPTEAAAAWLDDDVATGAPVAKGHQFYMLSLSEPMLLSNFCISGEKTSGSINLYASDTAAPPTSASWKLIAKDLSVEALNNKKLASSFNRFAKYLLIESNTDSSSRWYSLYVYGEKPAVTYHLDKRDQSIDTKAIFGQSLNEKRDFSLSSLYANGTVSYGNYGEQFVALQQAIDDNPQSSIVITPSTTNPGAAIQLGGENTIRRISVLADAPVKGKLEFFIVTPENISAAASEGYIRVANEKTTLDNLTPAATIDMNGKSERGSVDFPATTGSALLVRWTPDNGNQNIALREVNTFSNYALNDYVVASDLAAVAEYDASKGDYKAVSKEALPPVAEFIPGQSPFVPGPLGFPPNLTNNLPPETPLSPE